MELKSVKSNLRNLIKMKEKSICIQIAKAYVCLKLKGKTELENFLSNIDYKFPPMQPTTVGCLNSLQRRAHPHIIWSDIKITYVSFFI